MKDNRYGVTLIAALSLLSGAAGTRGATPLKQTTVHGLVVLAGPDGQVHGKAMEIIATPGLGARGVHFASPVGKEMQTSLDEAVRVVKLRHADVDAQPVEFSFEDKYSSKDGGSAGAAFSLALLSACGDFQVAPDAAVTGDITVDGKIRPVGEVVAKVRAAALDHLAVVGVPASAADQIEDGILLNGPASMWQIPTFSMEVLDDAVALTRKDRDAKLAEAVKIFADLKAAYGEKPVESLAAGEPAAKLSRMLELAPNFVSAKYLQRLAAGKKPQRLSTLGSIRQAFAAMGPLRGPILGGPGGVPVGNDEAEKIRANLDKIHKIADPSAEPLFAPLRDMLDSYVGFQNLPRTAVREKMQLRQDLRTKHAAVLQALQSVISDPDTVDKLLHGAG